jgi:hypothetical protein
MEQSTCNTATTNRFSRPFTTRLTIGLSFLLRRRGAKAATKLLGWICEARCRPSLTSLAPSGEHIQVREWLLATQVYEKVDPASLHDVQALLDWSELRVYDLNEAGKNHGILLGTNGWKP